MTTSTPAPRVLTVTSQKGGVGKTTLTVQLVQRSIERGLRTLLIDLDTQGNATTALTRDFEYLARKGGSATLFAARAPRDLQPVRVTPTLDLLHGHQYLDEVDRTIDPGEVIRTLHPLLRRLPYERILIDTPPGMSQRQLAALLTADLVLIPLEPASFAVNGLTLTLRTVTSARKLNPSLNFQVVVNRLSSNSHVQKKRLEEIRQHVPLREPPMTLRSAVSEAIEDGVPVWRHRKADRRLRKLWLDFVEEALR